MALKSCLLGYSTKGFTVVNKSLRKHRDLWYWAANPLHDTSNIYNRRLTYTSSTEIKQRAISFIHRAINCSLNLKDVEAKVQLYSTTHDCPSPLEISGRSMNINYGESLECANNLCSKRDIHAIGLIHINIPDIEDILQVYVKSLKVLFLE